MCRKLNFRNSSENIFGALNESLHLRLILVDCWSFFVSSSEESKFRNYKLKFQKNNFTGFVDNNIRLQSSENTSTFP